MAAGCCIVTSNHTHGPLDRTTKVLNICHPLTVPLKNYTHDHE
ncbi:hypothetical protein ACP70R_027010 [Stipagrostis hirtigluma subsp. patula]